MAGEEEGRMEGGVEMYIPQQGHDPARSCVRTCLHACISETQLDWISNMKMMTKGRGRKKVGWGG